ncbi:MAG TPA: hypothetical protein VGO68_20100 [Pyrinomonadaceae bacterium]|nr:hypothetical protein [Pyrinomonadaceae bacterium]
MECADRGGTLDFLAFTNQGIQSGVALRLPPHSKISFQQPESDITTHVSPAGREIGTYMIQKLLGAGGKPDSRQFIYVHEGKVFIANLETNKVREIYSHQPEEIRNAVGADRKSGK